MTNLSVKDTLSLMRKLGVNKICEAVVSVDSKGGPLYENNRQRISNWNSQALELKKIYGDFYILGFHIHPDFVEESCLEIDHMHAQGIRLIGELVLYLCG